MTSSTDPFSASIIPFEVPEQMRAFAEKGVSQARDNYAKFKDAAETHNGTIEAVFTTRQQGRQRILRQADGILQGQHHLVARLRAGAVRREDARRGDGAVDLAHPQAVRDLTAQAKELAELSQKVATETVEPIKASASKFYKPAA